MDQILIGVQEKWRVLLLSFDELTQVSRCCMSGKFEILSGKCQGFLFPLECGNPDYYQCHYFCYESSIM